MVLLQLALILLIATTTADRILYLPPPNSVDDYIRIDFSDDGTSITEVTIAVWVKPTTLDRSLWGFFFSYMSSPNDDNNMLLLGGKETECLAFAVKSTSQESASCSKYNIADGKPPCWVLMTSFIPI